MVYLLLLSTIFVGGISGAAADSGQIHSAYKVGPEDVIAINVARHPEFSAEFFIPSDGIIDVPAVGDVQAAGKTLKEIAAYVSDRLRVRLKEPEVSVVLKTPRMQRVYVLGSVKTPGFYDIKAGWRITEAVAAAGGLAEGVEPADCTAVILRASSKQRETFKFTEVLYGSAQSNAPLESGDVLSIETQETIPVYVMGRVKNPGVYKVKKENAGVMEALTLAGGPLEDAAISRVTVTSPAGSSTTVDLCSAINDGKPVENIRLQSGDMILVPEHTARVAVLGFVNEPGFYPIKDGQKVTLSDAVSLAKGVQPKRAGINSVAVIRTINGKQEKHVYNLTKFLKSGDLSQNPVIMAGDVVFVPETGKLDWDFVFKALSSVGILLNPFF